MGKLEFEIKNCGEMTVGELLAYHHSFLEFMDKVVKYSQGLDLVMKMAQSGLEAKMKIIADKKCKE